MAETAGKDRGKRMEALAGAGLGLVLLLVCSGFLWRLEGRPEGKADRPAVEVLELEADGSSGPVPSGRLVHLSGLVETPEVLTDSLTGSSVQALGIRREVEYFQWVEVLRPAAASSDGPRKAEDYAYHQRWVAEPVDSSAFHSEEARRRFANMTLVRLTNESRYAGEVRLGVYRLPPGLTASLPAEEPFTVTVSGSLRDELNRQAAQAHRSAGRGPLLLSNVVHAQGGIIYIGAGGTPQNGDVRVIYSQIPPMRASLAGAVQGTDVTAWRGEGGEICRLLPGGADRAGDAAGTDASRHGPGSGLGAPACGGPGLRLRLLPAPATAAASFQRGQRLRVPDELGVGRRQPAAGAVMDGRPHLGGGAGGRRRHVRAAASAGPVPTLGPRVRLTTSKGGNGARRKDCSPPGRCPA